MAKKRLTRERLNTWLRACGACALGVRQLTQHTPKQMYKRLTYDQFMWVFFQTAVRVPEAVEAYHFGHFWVQERAFGRLAGEYVLRSGTDVADFLRLHFSYEEMEDLILKDMNLRGLL